MSAVIADSNLLDHIMADRRARGVDRWDEVWDGTYIIMPLPNIEHQEIVAGLIAVLIPSIQYDGLGKALPGVTVSDRTVDWQENYRCPDLVVFLNETQAVSQGTHWYGGPDFGVEVVSPGDRSREKLSFYASVSTQELLIVDREPWQLELYRLQEGRMVSAGTATVENGTFLESHTIPFRFALRAGEERPVLLVEHVPSRQEWLI